jgi:predicted dehydrogenase/nucleoside-diphosphate-sugar epimerase
MGLMTDKKLRVGILGCGNVATHHARFCVQHTNADLVGVADPNLGNARSLAAASGQPDVYSSLEEMLDSSRLDVVHVLTPPILHYQHAHQALSQGVSVLVEKPTTTRLEEAEELYEMARTTGASLCPDFIQMFHPAALRLEQIAANGRYGKLVHVECNFTIDPWLQDVMESVGLHWSFRLPLGIFQNYITHPLYLVLRWTGLTESIHVVGKSTGSLPHGLTDHLELLIEGQEATGRMIMSSASDQPAYYLRAFFERGDVTVEFPTNTLTSRGISPLPHVIDRGLSGFIQGAALAGEGVRNIVDFVRGRLVPYQGLQVLIDRFYKSIQEGTAPPVTQELALDVARAEEFSLRGQTTQVSLEAIPARVASGPDATSVLLTGGTGYMGREVARQLVLAGHHVRALVRPLSKTEVLKDLGVELVYGDVRDRVSVAMVCEGMDYVIHCAAALSGTLETMMETAAGGTQNTIDCAREAGIRRGVYVSSCAVYDYSALKNGQSITELSELEATPEERGGGTIAKRAAEDIATAAMERGDWTILRPSLLVGNGRNNTSPVGTKMGRYLICFGGPRKKLRLIHVEDAALAAISAMTDPEAAGQLFLVSHPEHPTFKEYVNTIVRPAQKGNIRVFYLRRWMFEGLTLALKTLRVVSKRFPRISRKRRDYLYRDVGVDSSSIREAGLWKPRSPILESLAARKLSAKTAGTDLVGLEDHV